MKEIGTRVHEFLEDFNRAATAPADGVGCGDTFGDPRREPGTPVPLTGDGIVDDWDKDLWWLRAGRRGGSGR